MQFDVIVSGLNVIDLLLTLPEQYTPGRKHQVDTILIQGGAPAGNAASGLAQLGLKTAFLGFTGKNTPSDIAINDFHRCGVDTSLMLEDADAKPAIALVEVDPSNGDRTVFYSMQDYHPLAPSDIDPNWVKNSKLVFVDGYDMEGNLALLKLAKEFGVPSVVDIEAGDPSQLKEMLSLAGHAILPLEAAQDLTGQQDAEACLKVLAKMTEAQLVVTDGANGSWALEGETIVHQGIYPVQVVDTTGCGDAYHASYAYALLQDYSLAERVRFAAGFAAKVACHLGGRTEFPSAKQVHSFIQSHESR